MITPFEKSNSIAANTDTYIDLLHYFGRIPVEYVRVKVTQDFRLWMIFYNGNVQEYLEGGTANIPAELMDYHLKGIILRTTAAGTYYLHATTAPPAKEV